MNHAELNALSKAAAHLAAAQAYQAAYWELRELEQSGCGQTRRAVELRDYIRTH